ncbi:MAG: hypothetical protein PHZ25_01380 [Candidatus Pacebacteria bacterium]|nr:hypothetical protein [Candidatus Paceibacterota bacterium]
MSSHEPYFELDLNQLSLVFIIQESISRIMGDYSSLSDLKVFGPFFISHEGGDYQNFSPFISDLILEEKTCFQFSVSVMENGECILKIDLCGLILGYCEQNLFFIEEVLLNDGIETHLISFSKELSSVSEPVSFH